MKTGDSQIIETVTTDGEIITYTSSCLGVDVKATQRPREGSASKSERARRAARAAPTAQAARLADARASSARSAGCPSNARP